MHLRRLYLLTGAVMLCGCAAPVAGDEASALVVAPLQVDTASSRVYIKVTSATRLGHSHGVAGQLASGTVRLGGAGDLGFDMRTFIADRPEARSYVRLDGVVSASDAQKTTTTMLGKDVLNVERFPTARYTFRSSVPLDGQEAGAPGRYRLNGAFTLHGVTHTMPLMAVVEKTSTPGILRLRCAFEILQTQFGMKPYSAFGGLVGVEDGLQIWGDLVVRPKTAPTTAAASASSAAH